MVCGWCLPDPSLETGHSVHYRTCGVPIYEVVCACPTEARQLLCLPQHFECELEDKMLLFANMETLYPN